MSLEANDVPGCRSVVQRQPGQHENPVPTAKATTSRSRRRSATAAAATANGPAPSTANPPGCSSNVPSAVQRAGSKFQANSKPDGAVLARIPVKAPPPPRSSSPATAGPAPERSAPRMKLARCRARCRAFRPSQRARATGTSVVTSRPRKPTSAASVRAAGHDWSRRRATRSSTTSVSA